MDWPIATCILGILGTITAAIIKLVPQRTIVENSKGEKCASGEDVKSVLHAVQEHQKYSELRNHDMINAIALTKSDILNALQPISHDIVILVERTRHNRASHDDIS